MKQKENRSTEFVKVSKVGLSFSSFTNKREDAISEENGKKQKRWLDDARLVKK
ncbi:hypothetical protein [Longitalea luteola]|uniref:hypothetical protein n=1 Tax=Longitalea luteola TaxID=2812563 RepID=UPI001A96DC20|nr:hypothetical protein [Longitalea luteola]